MPTVRGFDLLGGGIKQIISGTSYISSVSKTITISEVDVNKSIIITKYVAGYGDSIYVYVASKIDNSTSLSFRRGASDGSLYFSYQVVEFNNVKSLQRGEVSFSSQSTVDIIINEVNPLKSLAIVSHYITINGYGLDIYYYLYNSTTLRVKLPVTGTGVIYWQVVEFN